MPVVPEFEQVPVISYPLGSKIFLEGPAGAGKTTAGVQRLLHLLNEGAPASSILVLAPQRTLAAPYQAALRSPDLRAGGLVTVLTAGGLARRMVELFWPLAAEEAGFARPEQPPTFLTLETAQYYMARLVRPLLEQEALFDSLVIDRNRLYSQILDNLNKAALVGFPYAEIGERLRQAWMGDPAQARVYSDAQRCASLFRAYCREHNLLDFSLQVEVFRRQLWPLPACRDYLLRAYKHLVADNIEEDTPFAHDLLRDWLPHLESALLIFDQEAGYRQFLGADPESAYKLKELCQEHVIFGETFTSPPALETLSLHLAEVLRQPAPLLASQAPANAEAVRAALVYEQHRYYPEMLDWVADEIAVLIQDRGVAPGEIVVLAPFLSDALRFSLQQRLERRGVPSRSHRPSRALRDEPATQCLLTLAALAHPAWGLRPSKFDFTYALIQAIDELDLVRAQLLAEIVFRRSQKEGALLLSSFEQINPEMRERITYVLGGRYDSLRLWLRDYTERDEAPLDHFLSRLFGELLSQKGFGFHEDFDAGQVAANLVESVQKFRWGVERSVIGDQSSVIGDRSAVIGDQSSVSSDRSADSSERKAEKALGQEYLEMVRDGVIAAQYVGSWRRDAPPAGLAAGKSRSRRRPAAALPAAERQEEAVLLAPAYTFLMSNRPVDYQFWLNAGATGWFERLYQPLTHPYVLSRHWAGQRAWSDADEFAAGQQRLYRLAAGLLRRCRQQIYLGLSELGEQGFEQRGPFLAALNQVLRRLPAEESSN